MRYYYFVHRLMLRVAACWSWLRMAAGETNRGLLQAQACWQCRPSPRPSIVGSGYCTVVHRGCCWIVRNTCQPHKYLGGDVEAGSLQANVAVRGPLNQRSSRDLIGSCKYILVLAVELT